MKFFPSVFALLLALHFSFFSQAQSDSCNITVSLLTAGPGDEVYSIFGHSALRVVDKSRNTDLVFNYGTFDAFEDDFEMKFIKGSLLYSSSIEQFNNHDGYLGFFNAYKAEGRSIQEQILNLSCEQKLKLYDALKTNALPQNRYYLYEFLYDNCSTRLRDIVEKNSAPFVTRDILEHKSVTFRDLIYIYLNRAKQYWTKLGIDILLGANMDRKATNRESMFLPDYLLKGFDSTTINGKPLVSEKHTLFEQPDNSASAAPVTPMLAFVLLFILVGICSLVKHPAAKTFLKIFDPLLFFLTGALGILLVFMWVGTTHLECKNNLNLLWAIPTHFVAAFFLGSNKKWVKTYFKLTAWLSLLLLICWIILPQALNVALIPLVGVLFLRSQRRSR
ncbi:lipoprotein N-acyltransferase Lnb domain-containing protein [Pinibacter aurantiacus]|uniref:DUF4105 domain-containing protein n=1 Tax=Pinibacter aurantiacus TaxID=2851599 RepID=A0A9E2SBA6_9BACT|nr:DUF4105 domain-containing protein [Pinibacter aurantiacus]MBV4358162.1 DUF4105 domain-containing protein [Pinibacter aurantiacus]